MTGDFYGCVLWGIRAVELDKYSEVWYDWVMVRVAVIGFGPGLVIFISYTIRPNRFIE